MIRRWFPTAVAAVVFLLLMRCVEAGGPAGGAENQHMARASALSQAAGSGDLPGFAAGIRMGGLEAPFAALWTAGFMGLFSPEVRIARLASAAAFTLAVLVLHSLLKRRGGGRGVAGWLLLLAFSSGLATLTARTATPWAVGLLMVVAAMAAVVEAQAQGGILRAGAAGLVAGAAALGTGPLWPWMTGAFLLNALWSGVRRGGEQVFPMGPFVGGLAVLPLWWHLVGGGAASTGIPLTLPGGWPGAAWIPIMAGWASFSIPSLMLQGLGLALLARKGTALGVLALCLAVAGSVGWVCTPGRQPEWLLPGLAAWWVAGAHALGGAFEKVRRPRERVGLALLATVAILMTPGRGVRSLVRLSAGMELPAVVVRDWSNLYGPRVLTGPEEGP